ncbi:MAG: hypothetical protein KJ052_01785 [Candidatus Hydrogenedentes bacterium]|nr:hypothetical protein [Candidatus Hydrogenedentota bacterium]
MTASPDGEALDAIYGAWSRYKNAILDGDGEAAVAEVSPGIIAYFDELRCAVLYMPEDELRALPLIDKVTILSLRTQATVEDLTELDARELYSKGVREGWTSKDVVRRMELGSCIGMDGNKALMKAHNVEQETVMVATFLKVDVTWKFDLLSMLRQSATALDTLCATSKVPENDFVVRMLRIASRQENSSDIWKPLLNTLDEPQEYTYIGKFWEGEA